MKKEFDMDLEVRAAIYCRVSSREQAINGYGIDVQKNKINDYMKVYEVKTKSVAYYIDEGISAKNLNRDEIKRLIEDIKNHKIDVVYIYKLDRLSRSVVDIYNLVSLFSNNNCNLVAIMDHIDINSANGRLFIGILAIIAQWERETITERTHDGVEEMVKSGKYPYGARPTGYIKNEDLTLKLHPEESKALIYAVKKCIEGITLKELERLLLEKFNMAITSERLKEIILKPWYYGLFYYNGQIYRNIFPMIYTEEEAILAQKMISKRFKTYDDSRYYFGNKIRCTCGEVLDHKSTKKKDRHYFYYWCSNCKKRINQDHIVEQTLYSMAAVTSEKATQSNNTRALAKLNRMNQKINDLHIKYINDKINMEVYLMALYRLEYDKKIQISKIKTEKLIDFMKWDEMDDTERKQFIHNHIKNITVDVKANIVINVKYLK